MILCFFLFFGSIFSSHNVGLSRTVEYICIGILTARIIRIGCSVHTLTDEAKMIIYYDIIVLYYVHWSLFSTSRRPV